MSSKKAHKINKDGSKELVRRNSIEKLDWSELETGMAINNLTVNQVLKYALPIVIAKLNEVIDVVNGEKDE